MKRFSQRQSYSTLAELNVTPLIDLAFVLLIIFMITAPLLEHQLEVRLPTASPQSLQVDPGFVLTIAVDQQGDLYLEKKQKNFQQLEESLRESHRQHPDLAVLIRIDAENSVQRLVDVLDVLKKVGISKMSISHSSPLDKKKKR